MRYSYVDWSGAVQVSTYAPEEWTPVPGGSLITGVRLGDWVASEHEVGERPQEVGLASQLFATDGAFRVNLTTSVA